MDEWNKGEPTETKLASSLARWTQSQEKTGAANLRIKIEDWRQHLCYYIVEATAGCHFLSLIFEPFLIEIKPKKSNLHLIFYLTLVFRTNQTNLMGKRKLSAIRTNLVIMKSLKPFPHTTKTNSLFREQYLDRFKKEKRNNSYNRCTESFTREFMNCLKLYVCIYALIYSESFGSHSHFSYSLPDWGQKQKYQPCKIPCFNLCPLGTKDTCAKNREASHGQTWSNRGHRGR